MSDSYHLFCLWTFTFAVNSMNPSTSSSMSLLLAFAVVAVYRMIGIHLLFVHGKVYQLMDLVSHQYIMSRSNKWLNNKHLHTHKTAHTHMIWYICISMYKFQVKLYLDEKEHICKYEVCLSVSDIERTQFNCNSFASFRFISAHY